MAVKAVPVDVQTRFYPEDQRNLKDEDGEKIEGFYFLIKYPDIDVREKIDNAIMDMVVLSVGQATNKFTRGTQRKIYLMECILGWGNLEDSNGDPVKFDDSTEEQKKKSISRVPWRYCVEVADHLAGLADAFAVEV